MEVGFYNFDDDDKVEKIIVGFSHYDTENKIRCKDAIVKSLEISFCGRSIAKEYTNEFSSVGKYLSIYDDEQNIASYSLANKADVSISCGTYGGERWHGEYSISEK